ncbi:hypothetical protein PHYC_02515 [Phycisphaerales bacterium]|nr:hypothetical protein PHYC_02515 [Phycisphaerales bacterium]
MDTAFAIPAARTDLFSGITSARDAHAGSERELFAATLARARGTNGSPQVRARDAAEQLIANSLVAPVLKSLRESNGAAAPFAPGPGERTFRAMMDDMVAQRMVKSTHWSLVDSVARRVLRNVGQAPEGPPCS